MLSRKLIIESEVRQGLAVQDLASTTGSLCTPGYGMGLIHQILSCNTPCTSQGLRISFFACWLIPHCIDEALGPQVNAVPMV
jgi:hypothetical protein